MDFYLPEKLNVNSLSNNILTLEVINKIILSIPSLDDLEEFNFLERTV